MDEENRGNTEKLAWAQRHHLNELADRIERQFQRLRRPTYEGGTGTWLGAVGAIAESETESADLVLNLQALIQHVRRYYPSELV